MFEDPELDALEDAAERRQPESQGGASPPWSRHARRRASHARRGFRPSPRRATPRAGKPPSTNRATSPARLAIGNSFVVRGDLSYEVDLFGRIRDTVAGARAATGDRRGRGALDLALHAELATDYFRLRGLDRQQLLDRTVADYAARASADPDISTTAAPRRSPTCSRPRRSSRPPAPRPKIPACAARRTSTPSRCSSAARPAPSARRPAAGAGNSPLPPWDPALPSHLLERRPDVAAAERRVAAANAGIGVARAAYFPVLTARLRRHRQRIATSQLVHRARHYWSIGPQALLTVFDGGLHAAQSAPRTRLR